MATSPTENSALLQEVDEAVRQDQIANIWRRFGLLLVAAVIAALLGFGGWLYWQHQQNVKRGENAETLIAAYDKIKGNEPRAATKMLQGLEAGGDGAYRAIALVQQSNMKLKTGDTKAASALLGRVANDPKVDSSLRDMALVRKTAIEFDTLKPEEVISRMKPIVDAKDPLSSWFPSAAELLAVTYYQMGKTDEAGSLYGRIAKLPDIPKSLQSRAVQMAGMLGVDAVVDRAAESEKKDGNDATANAAPSATNGKAK